VKIGIANLFTVFPVSDVFPANVMNPAEDKVIDMEERPLEDSAVKLVNCIPGTTPSVSCDGLPLNSVDRELLVEFPVRVS
jgi:hypothetical protein